VTFVSITRLRVRSWRFLPIFFLQALRIGRQAAKSDGNLASRLLRERQNAFWTITTWTTEAAMKAFMHAKPHGPVMRKLQNWCDEAAVVHWSQEGAEPPSWPEAHTRLQQEGRRSKVNHPSAAHSMYIIPPPAATKDLRLK
jgi:hypothetical protein